MGYWKCEICGTEFDNFHAQGFDNKVYCPLCFFKEKTNRLEKIRTQLKEENKRLEENNSAMQEEMARTWKKVDLYKEVIEEVREYIKGFDIERLHETCEHNLADVLEYLLEILDKAKGEENGK